MVRVEAPGTSATRSTGERKGAKCKEEDEKQGPRDPSPRALGRADTFNSIQAQRSTNDIHRNEHRTLFRGERHVTSNLLSRRTSAAHGGLSGGRVIREGSRGRGVCPTIAEGRGLWPDMECSIPGQSGLSRQVSSGMGVSLWKRVRYWQDRCGDSEPGRDAPYPGTQWSQ